MGGKGGVSLPNYSWLEGAYKEQMAFNKDVYNEMSPYYKGMMEQQIDSSKQQMDQAKDYYDYMRNTFRPLEQRMVDDAQRQNTDAYREGLARQAMASAQTAFDSSMGQLERTNASMGLGSKLTPAQERAMALGLTAQKAAGAEGARQGGLGAGMAAMQNAIGLGRNLPQNSTNAYAGAANAAHMAAGIGQMPSQQYQTANLNTLSGLNSLYGTQTEAYMNQTDPLAMMAGAGLQMLTTYKGWSSDRRLKQDITRIGTYPNGLPAYEFAYKEAPERRFRGVMADDVAKAFPDAVFTFNGYQAVNYDLLGIELEEVTHG